ncbi:TlpA family protein disulfide reductase [Flavobacterium sp. SM2513]|uniref:TlpA family protein disulfide reductase n=1 Tax=Flavobacterium sp. SM2513 TaxID=3424766 RepID=UPI003D7FB6CB
MKTKYIITILLISIILFSCQDKSVKTSITEPKIDPNELENDFMKWWNYHSSEISLANNFIGLNEASDTINKKDFLTKLTSGNYIVLKLKSKDKNILYKLYQLNPKSDKSIKNTISIESLINLEHYKMEGERFPEFNFIDLNGNNFSNENLKGKMVIYKTWFINCKACVAEFPELNELVEKNKNNKEIVFISLALDEKDKLVSFLKRKDFKYEIVPNQKELIVKKLNLTIYPSHIVVDKNGVIIKVVNKASEMIDFLENNKKKF